MQYAIYLVLYAKAIVAPDKHCTDSTLYYACFQCCFRQLDERYDMDLAWGHLVWVWGSDHSHVHPGSFPDGQWFCCLQIHHEEALPRTIMSLTFWQKWPVSTAGSGPWMVLAHWFAFLCISRSTYCEACLCCFFDLMCAYVILSYQNTMSKGVTIGRCCLQRGYMG